MITRTGPIGIFDSGYGGLSIFKEIRKSLPKYDYVYLGDNARVPYGTRSFETVYQYTLEGVMQLFNLQCPLIILACNTASAKALRTIQTLDLPRLGGYKRVLGVIRPTTEQIGNYTRTRKIGILATPGTVRSQSYLLEINRFFPELTVYQQACPLWVPLIENGDLDNPGAEHFIAKDIQTLLQQDPDMDTIVLACTHYPLILPIIRKYTPAHIQILPQGPLVAQRLKAYLDIHQDMNKQCSQEGHVRFLTTESAIDFERMAPSFYGELLKVEHIDLPQISLKHRGLR